jgi:ribonuclease E
MSRFCLVEIAREKIRPGIRSLAYQECKSCRGLGFVKSPESVALEMIRSLRAALAERGAHAIQARCHPDAASYLLNQKRAQIRTLEEKFRRQIVIEADASVGPSEFEIKLLDRHGEELGQESTI